MTNITQQEIIEIAKEADLISPIDKYGIGFNLDKLTKFAQLIEARLAARSDERQSREVFGYVVSRYSEGEHEKDEYFTTKESAYENARWGFNETKITPVYLAAPQQAIPAEVNVTKWQIEMEKLLCEKLNRKWTAGNISIESLIDELVHRAAPTAPIDNGMVCMTITKRKAVNYGYNIRFKMQDLR